MSYIIKQKIGDNYYAYEVESYWDKDKKQARQKRKYLGVWDEEKGVIKEKKNKVKTTKSYGDVYLFSEVVEQLELDKTLKLFPEWKQILALAFSRLRNPASMKLSKCFLEDTYFGEKYEAKIPSSQRISTILAKIPDRLPEFFKKWIKDKDSSALVYDITSLSSTSRNISLLEFGYNRDGDKLPQVNLGVVTNSEGIPLYFKVFPGSITDVTTIHNLLNDLRDLKVRDCSIVLDRGFYSQKNLEEILDAEIDFVMPMPFTTNLAKKLASSKIQKPENATRYEGRTVFVSEGKSTVKDKEVYTYTFYDEKRKAEETDRFYNRLMDLESLNGKEIEEKLSSFLARIKEDKYFKWSVEEGRVYCTRKPKTISRRVNRMGKLVILSTTRMEGENILSIYREKDIIEKFYYSLKEMSPLRVGRDDTLVGLLFVNFIALVVRNKILKMMREADLLKKMSVQELFMEMAKLRAVKLGQEWRLTEVTKNQRNIMEKLGVEVPDSTA